MSKTTEEEIRVRISEDIQSNTVLNDSINKFCIEAFKIFNWFEIKSNPTEPPNNNVGERWRPENGGNPKIALFANALLKNENVDIPSNILDKVEKTESFFGMVSIKMPKSLFPTVTLGPYKDVSLSLRAGFTKKQFKGLFDIDGADPKLVDGGFTIVFEDERFKKFSFINSFDGTAKGLMRKMKKSFQRIIDLYFPDDKKEEKVDNVEKLSEKMDDVKLNESQ